MSERCEPPEHLREVDGWHWVQEPVNTLVLARWHRAESPGVEPLWTSTHHVYPGTPRYAAREWGWTYLAPVTPPATVAALVEALEGLVMAAELPGDHCEVEQALPAARAALTLYRNQQPAPQPEPPHVPSIEDNYIEAMKRGEV